MIQPLLQFCFVVTVLYFVIRMAVTHGINAAAGVKSAHRLHDCITVAVADGIERHRDIYKPEFRDA